MSHKSKLVTRLNINGFSINPVADKTFLFNIIKGLTEYDDKHFCDYGKNVVHKNYIGTPVFLPEVTLINENERTGFVGFCVLTNGYLVIRMFTNTYPSTIEFDLVLDDKLEDIDLIIDHLCAPAIPNDGLGMFDYTYSLKTEKMLDNSLFKDNQNDSPYHLNDQIKFLDEGKTEWEVVLNELKTIECYYCKDNGTNWIFIDDVANVHLDFKSVVVCKAHMHRGRIRELSSTLGNAEGKDFYKSATDISFLPKHVVDEDGNILYTKNFPVEREVNDD
jgi:hypothetical protein